MKYYAHVSSCKLEIIEEFYDENNENLFHSYSDTEQGKISEVSYSKFLKIITIKFKSVLYFVLFSTQNFNLSNYKDDIHYLCEM